MKKYPWIRCKVRELKDGSISLTLPKIILLSNPGTEFIWRAYRDKSGSWRAYSRIVSIPT
jgi:hypothetical protein